MNDAQRSAALHLWPHRLSPTARVGRGLAPRLPTRQPRRFAQAVAVKKGQLDWERNVVEPLLRFRRAALGAEAAGPPRVLVRVDEFPHARAFDPAGRFGTESFRRFHAVLAEAGIPYLLAITPNVSRDYLDPEVEERRRLDAGEVETIGDVAADRVVFGLHGADHRTRHANPRRHSEFLGLGTNEAALRIDGARAVFDALGHPTPVFVPPFNRFDRSHYRLLAKRFEVVCGGPESVRLLGWQPTPVWQREAVYLPSYAPIYGTSAEAAAGVERLLELEAGIWAPVTLHWGWELEDDFASLRRLCGLLQGIAADWTEFLAAVAATR
ncbi:MAG TPA: DUF2334 domain-containing protein [Solirubrobacterales bacterium]|nr:DUF2334 domain-containing protein [Solirubrobacterales bacterium]